MLDGWAAVLSPAPPHPDPWQDVGVRAAQARLTMEVLRAARVLVWLGVVVAAALAVLLCRAAATAPVSLAVPVTSAGAITGGVAALERRRRRARAARDASGRAAPQTARRAAASRASR